MGVARRKLPPTQMNWTSPPNSGQVQRKLPYWRRVKVWRRQRSPYWRITKRVLKSVVFNIVLEEFGAAKTRWCNVAKGVGRVYQR
jgi:hypothetical protein